ncbi:MAG: DUF2589 domain-containing protein [Holophagales bacterium]|nr:DUF2589 domain-containing protein [Holophagales bacterium]
MIRFDDLVAAIQGSVLEASHALTEHNLQVLDRFFEKADGEDVESRIQAALSASSDVSDSTDPEEISRAADAIRDAAAALEQRPRKDCLVPVTVAMEYPKMTAEGPTSHVVNVPLLSLAPMTLSQIDELRFRTDLELSEVDGELQVGFPERQSDACAGGYASPPGPADRGPGSRGTASAHPNANACVEIVVRPACPTEGMKMVNEGYYRALRAQIPG